MSERFDSPIARALDDAAVLAESKNKEYGNTYDQTGQVMYIIFGQKQFEFIGPKAYSLYSVLTWIVGKLCRFATAKSEEARKDSLRDLVVYSAMAYHIYTGGPNDEH